MSAALFAYPPQAEFGRVVPKSKIYAYARASRSMRDRFVKEVDQVVWKYKLGPETINLPARPGVPEIQVFGISLRTDQPSESVLRTIDKAISFPILFELTVGNLIQSIMAYKRRSDADSAKWVVDSYFASDWINADGKREPLPVALDLAQLYEQLLRRHITIPSQSEETLKDHVERVNRVRGMETERRKLELRLKQEKQFNRKVEISRELRQLSEDLESLQQVSISKVGKRYG